MREHEDQKAVTKIALTPEERTAIVEYVQEAARRRKKGVGKMNEADFFCGAMSVMFAVSQQPPPGWVIGIMSDRPEMYGMEKKRGR